MELTEETRRALKNLAEKKVRDLVEQKIAIEDEATDVRIREEELQKAKDELSKLNTTAEADSQSLVDLIQLSGIKVDAYSVDAVFEQEFRFHEHGEEKIMFTRICGLLRNVLVERYNATVEAKDDA